MSKATETVGGPDEAARRSGRTGRLAVALIVFASFLTFSAVRAPVPAPNEPHYLTKAKHYWHPGWCAGDLFLESADVHIVFYQTVGLLTNWLTLEQTAWAGRIVGYGLLAVGWTMLMARILPAPAGGGCGTVADTANVRENSEAAADADGVGHERPAASEGSCRSFSGRRWWAQPTLPAAVAACWAFLALQAAGSLSGEWLVGGIEAKVFAYALLLMAMAWMIDAGRAGDEWPGPPGSRTRQSLARSRGAKVWRLRLRLAGNRLFKVTLAALAAGGAVSFHPVVGGWGVFAGLFATAVVLVSRVLKRGQAPFAGGALAIERSQFQKGPDPFSTAEDGGRCPPYGVVIPLAVFVLAALPGLIPALELIAEKPAAGTAFQADRIQVYYRLDHHLDPTTFHRRQWLGGLASVWVVYAAMTGFWLAGRFFARLQTGERWFRWFVVACILIALAGLLVGWGPRNEKGLPPRDADYPLLELRTRLMKFYPFRLADSILPLAVAVVLTGLAGRVRRKPSQEGELKSRNRRRRLRVDGNLFLFPLYFVLVLAAPNTHANPSKLKPAELSDWVAACRWIEANTPEDTLFLETYTEWAFKWYAQRAEYVSFKDCPQDAAGILEWNRRLLFVSDWLRQGHRAGFTAESLEQLRERGVTHVVSHREFPAFVVGDLSPGRADKSATTNPPGGAGGEACAVRVYRNDTFAVYALDECSE